MAISKSNETVITGLGVVTPLGVGIDHFWSALIDMRSGIREFSGGLGHLSSIGFGGILHDFDAKEYVRPRKALKVMCREIQTAFSAATMAIEQADLSTSQFPPERIATVFGSEMMSGEPDELSDTLMECGILSGKPNVAEFGEAAMRKVFPLWMLKYLPNMATCHVGIAIGALGPNNTIVLGDTSGLAALSEAVSVIERGHADAVVCGGAGTRVSESRLGSSKLLPLPSRCEPVSTSSRPFSVDSTGIVGGEAAAAMVLETRASALGRGVRPLARIEGTAVRFVAPNPNQETTEAIATSIRGVLTATGRSADQIGIIISQACGYPLYDRCEAEAVRNTLGPNKQLFAPIASLGHSGAASGSVALAIGTLIAHHQIVPPSLNWEEADPTLGVKLASQSEALDEPCVLVLSHTGQGHACASILSVADTQQN